MTKSKNKTANSEIVNTWVLCTTTRGHNEQNPHTFISSATALAVSKLFPPPTPTITSMQSERNQENMVLSENNTAFVILPKSLAVLTRELIEFTLHSPPN